MIDLAIVGGGPGGLSAALYASRMSLDTVVFEKGAPGGAITLSSEIENYPGVCEVKTGMELMQCWPEQAMRFGAKIEMEYVEKVTLNDDGTFKLHLYNKEIDAISVIIATGSSPKRAGFEGEEDFIGKGISTCAVCDGFFYKNQEVAVVGGGDTALEESLYLSKIAKKVYLIHRRDKFRAAPGTIKRVLETDNIEILYNSVVKKAYGDNLLEGIIIQKEDKEIDLKVPGVFVFVGMNVNNNVIINDNKPLCDLNEKGEIIVDLNMQSSQKGLFAIGDVRSEALRQVVIAAGDGAVAALNAVKYVENFKENK